MGVEYTVSGASNVLERTRDAVLLYDSTGAVADANDAAHDALPDTLLESSVDNVTGGETGPYRDALTAVRDGHRDDARARLVLDDVTLDARLTPVDDDAPRPVCAVFREYDGDPRVDDLALLNCVVRHDVRNRATVVSGWIDHLREHADPADQSTYDRVVGAVEDVIRTTDTARDIASAIVDGRVVTEPVSLASALDPEITAIRREHPEATVEAPEVDPDICVEATPMLGTVFYNLLQNAVVHNPSDDPHVAVGVEIEPDTVSVSVADDGPGIPPERVESVFERGAQGTGSEGEGLGLHLVEQFVRAFDGTVSVEENDPVGTVFVVTLQRA
ncbi:sensor histidine kinase [Halarchaeum sp. P4]|uniref:sensor histidine kinase n=1 Tax=Halarchaeum sp. P4 TaxID=3421639 RepID=UPI003EBCCF12